MMLVNNHHVTFESTGRTEYAYGGIVSVNDKLELSYGADGGFPTDFENPLTPAEKRELAQYMISRWLEYAMIV